MTISHHTICPHCDHEHDACSNIVSEEGDVRQTPHDGDASQCIACGKFSIFQHEAAGGMRKPTAKELRELIRDPRVRAMQDCWEELFSKRH
jgi:hypothetical protein